MDDLITIIDENNNVIGSAPRKEAHAKGMWHRIVVIHVFNSKGQVYIQKRSPNADTAPNKWDHSAAGHVDAGETPEEAAKRELSEDLGIGRDKLVFITTYKTQKPEGDKQLNRFWYLYSCVFDGEIHLQKEEITEGKFVDIEWLQSDMQSKPEIYTDGLKKSLQVYLDTISNK